MAEFKIFCDQVKIFPHPNAEKLVIGKIGPYQIVFSKDNGYVEGQRIIFAPERSLLPNDIKGNYCNIQTGVSYLGGPEQNRVKSIKLRGEPSEGVTLNLEWVLSKNPNQWKSLDDIPLNEDISEILGITKYLPQIPASMSGTLEVIENVKTFANHDCERLGIYADEFIDGEEVIVTSKLHGSMVSMLFTKDGKWYVTSKGIGKSGFAIQESESNVYWQAFNNSGLRQAIEQSNLKVEIQLIGECLPVQKGFSYGLEKPTVKLFRVLVDGYEMSYNDVAYEGNGLNPSTKHCGITSMWKTIFDSWVPVLYVGPYSREKVIELSKEKEPLANLHIQEGVVVSPIIPRRSKEGFKLYLKQINPKYLETGEEFN